MPSELNVNKISPASGTSVTLGDSGDTFTVPSGVTLSGSGASLTSLPAANLTGTLPALDGSNLTGVSAGKILQVKNAVKTDTSSINSASYADISGLSLSITPSATSSKILFFMSVSVGCGSDSNHVYLNMVRDSTNILVADTAGSRTSSTALVNTAGLGQTGQASASYLDSPSSISALTYKIQWKNNGSTTSYVNQSTRDTANSANDGRVTSQITVMEIGA
jgi:hypothetical protein